MPAPENFEGMLSPIADRPDPAVGIIMGSDSDLTIMRSAEDVLKDFGVDYEIRVVSAHRTPEWMAAYGKAALDRNVKVIIAGAGGSAHLPGEMASHTIRPVFGVGIENTPDGLNAAVGSIVAMPAEGGPNGFTGRNKAGAINAGLLAVQTLAIFDESLEQALLERRSKNALQVMEKDRRLRMLGGGGYAFVTSGGEDTSGVKKLAEGKTKNIWGLDHGLVLVESRDDITAGDGAKHDTIEGKGRLSTQTTANCFELLNRHGIPNHFISQETDNVFLAKEVEMIPIELVARRIAYGSYLNRNPEVKVPTRFSEIAFEMFAKDDSNGDPILVYDYEKGTVKRHNPKKPISKKTLVDEVPLTESPFILSAGQAEILRRLTVSTFLALETEWRAQDTSLVDLKIECGFDKDGEIVVADVIDNDSWRIWPGGKPENMQDKQLYRDGQPLGTVRDAYEWVATATAEFRTPKNTRLTS